jgi:hypothetical protein
MRASIAYFVGAGTIVAAIAIGLGGGIVAGNIMNPVASKQGPDNSKMAQRAEAAAMPATTNVPSERVQYLTGSKAFGTVIAAPAQAEAKPVAKPDTQAAQANVEPPAPQPSQAAAVEPPKPIPASPPQVARPAEQQVSTEPSASPEAYAKARDSDVKRAASERRRTDRRERWAERPRYDSREQRGTRERIDLDDVVRNVREDSDARDVASRPRGGSPRIMLFGRDDD